MKIFLDTANLDEIREAASLGLLDGVTTNPSLIAKENAAFEKRIVDICEVVQGPVSAEVTCTDTEGMCRQGRELAGSWIWARFKRWRKKDPREIERLRRLDVNLRGRISVAMIVDLSESDSGFA